MAGWTYAVGYLRSYAKLVGVGIDEAIKANESLMPQKNDGPGTLTHRTVGRVSIPISLSWVVTVVVVFIVVGGLGATYWKRANEEERLVLDNQTAATEIESPPATGSSTDESLALGISSPDSELDSIANNGSIGKDPAGEATLTQSRVSNKVVESSIEPKVIANSDVVQRQLASLTLASMDTRIIGSLRTTMLEQPEAKTLSDEFEHNPKRNLGSNDSDRSNARVFELFFDQGSWVDVRDSRDQQLLRDNMPAGTAVQLEGEPPFTIFVGNAAGVRYLYLGIERNAPASGNSLFGRFQLGSIE
jgi:cytoskeleton protein RodZ